jgi:hypothetical protein
LKLIDLMVWIPQSWFVRDRRRADDGRTVVGAPERRVSRSEEFPQPALE